MTIFQDIKLGWNGATYIIPANRVFGAIARMEDYIVLQDLVTATEVGRLPYAKASQAYAALLSYAGVPGVDPEQVYNGLFGDNKDGVRAMASALQTLRMIMIPPEHLQEKVKPDEGKAEPAGDSSSKPTGRRSAASGARRKNSGRSRL